MHNDSPNSQQRGYSAPTSKIVLQQTIFFSEILTHFYNTHDHGHSSYLSINNSLRCDIGGLGKGLTL